MIATWRSAPGLDRAWALAILARSRALLLAARAISRAPSRLRRGAGRARANRGSVPACAHAARARRTQRRAKQRGAARATLERRARRFERLGAPLWADRPRRPRPDRWPGAVRRRADGQRAPDRRARRRGAHEPRGRGCALRHRAHGRGSADARVPEARRPLARRARRSPSGKERRSARLQTVGISGQRSRRGSAPRRRGR